jgi:hypothetical protein
MNMKKTIIGLLAAAALFGGAATMAEAKTHFNLYLGVPYYDYQVGPDYRFNEDYGWYRPDYRPRYSQRIYRPDYRARLSCGEARGLVRERGFRNVIARDCNGRTYAFSATRHNHRVIVYVNSRTGAVSRG